MALSNAAPPSLSSSSMEFSTYVANLDHAKEDMPSRSNMLPSFSLTLVNLKTPMNLEQGNGLSYLSSTSDTVYLPTVLNSRIMRFASTHL